MTKPETYLEKYTKTLDIETNLVRANVLMCDLSKKELENWVRNTHIWFYFRPRQLWKRLRSMSSFGELKRNIIAGTYLIKHIFFKR